VPVGLLITFVIAALGLAASLRPPSRTGALGLLSWLFSAIPNESPSLVFYWLLISTVLGFGEGLSGGWVWVAAGLTLMPLLAAPVLLGRSRRARPALERALSAGLSSGSLPASGMAARRVPWLGALFAPLPLFHPRVRRIGGISYGEAGRRNRLDLYLRPSAATPRPVLIHLHGGGFSAAPGRKSFYARRLLFRLAREGWVCASATYRLSPAATFPDELIDVKKLIAWAKAHAGEHGGDPERIVLAGSSFGARLATLAGFTANDPRFQPGFEHLDTTVAAVVGLYGYYGAGGADRSLPSSPFDYADAGGPPLFVIHGGQDTLTAPATARALAVRAREASSSPVVYAELPGAQHSFDLLRSIRFEAVIDAVEAFARSLASPPDHALAAAETAPGLRR
jgi:acetyl esterase/lipase